MSSEANRIAEVLRWATTEFERNGFSRSAILQCEKEFPDLFVSEGLHVLSGTDELLGYRFLALLLLKSSSVFQGLTDRWRFTREEAVRIAQRMNRVEKNLDTKLTALLPDRNGTIKPFGLDEEHAMRALEILEEISTGRRIVPLMRHLTEHPNKLIAAKAALLIGKRMQNVSWARRVIAESNEPRLRANAVETMWAVTSPEAVELFRECLSDWDNRVVGNALIGLHLAGVPETKQLIAGIAGDAQPKLRMTAAWVMGKIADSGLVPILTLLARDGAAEVRRAAMRSLRNIHSAEQPADEEAPKSCGVESPVPAESTLQETAVLETPRQAVSQGSRQFWN